MPPTLKTRKPVDKFLPEDLNTFPLWKFALDEEGVEGQDETWVKPIQGDIIDPKEYDVIVATDFQTASGQKILGFVSVSFFDEIKVRPGALLFQGRYIFIPLEDDPFSEKDRKDFFVKLGMTAADVFPLTYKLRAPIKGEAAPRNGSVD